MKKKKRILIYYQILEYTPKNLDLLNREFKVITLYEPSLDSPDILKEAQVILAPLGYYLGKEKIDQANNLKIIGSNTTGHPHIDVEYAKSKNIHVVTMKNETEFLKSITPTAELTWGLIISLTRNILPSSLSVIDGKWSRWSFGGERMLSRMSLGVIGYGRLGKIVAGYGLCFGMKVSYYDPYVKEHDERIIRKESLEALVESSDIITLHVPHGKETENLINKETFFRFKKGAYFINTSRGELVDHEGLLQCLETGYLRGAALDVLSGEFDPNFTEKVSEHPVVKYAKNHSNLILTPHIGGSTKDAWQLTQEYTINKIIEHFDSHKSL